MLRVRLADGAARAFRFRAVNDRESPTCHCVCSPSVQAPGDVASFRVSGFPERGDRQAGSPRIRAPVLGSMRPTVSETSVSRFHGITPFQSTL